MFLHNFFSSTAPLKGFVSKDALVNMRYYYCYDHFIILKPNVPRPKTSGGFVSEHFMNQI